MGIGVTENNHPLFPWRRWAYNLAMRWAILLAVAFLGALEALAEPRYPAADRPWTQADYVNFYFSHYNGNQALPHLRSAPTKAVFARLVDQGNVERILAAPQPDAEKLRQVALILSITGEARAAYNYAVALGEPLQQELTQVQIFALYLVDVSVRLTGAVPDRRWRSSAWKTTLFGVLLSLSERDVYSTAQRMAFTDALAEYYPGIEPALNATDRRQFHDGIASLIAAEPDADMRAAQTRLLRAGADP